MKILLLSLNYAPELTGIGKYSGEMGAWLAKRGHDVRVVTAPPYYPEWKVSARYSSGKYMRESLDGVDVWRCPLYVPANPSGSKRIMHLASFALTNLPVMVRQVLWRPHVVFVVEPSLLSAPVSLLVSKLSGSKCWLHVQDFEVDAAFELGIIRFNFLKRFVLSFERWLMCRFDIVSTISSSMLALVKGKGVVSGRTALFPNWADLSHMQFTMSGRIELRAKLGIQENDCLCLYSGNIANKQGLEILLDVASRLPGHRFVICGEGSNKRALQEKAKSMALQNLSFLPLQPLDVLPALLSAADVHLVIQKAGAADLVMPSKLTNIFATGGAVVVTAEADTELGRLGVGVDPCVYRCEPENPKDLAAAISTLCSHPEQRNSLRRAARLYSKDHIAMDEVLRQFEGRLSALACKKKTVEL